MNGVRTVSSIGKVKMDSVHSGNIELVIKTVGSDGIVIHDTKHINDKGEELETTEYFLDVDEQVTEDGSDDAQFVPVDDDCEETHEPHYISMEVDDSDPLVLPDKIVIHWNKLCRICANDSDRLIPIFSGEGLEHNLCNKIHSYLPFRVTENDSLPVQVCYNCAATLLAWHEMAKGCLNAQQRLIDLQTKFNLKDEYYDSTVEQDNIEAILDVEEVNGEESQIQVRSENNIEAVTVADIESDRSRRIQTSIIELVDKDIISKEAVKEKKTLPNDKAAKGSPEPGDSSSRNKRNVDSDSLAMVGPDKGIIGAPKKRAKEGLRGWEARSQKRPGESLACDDCGRSFKAKDSLVRHLRIHRNERPFTCHVCGKQFRDSGGLCRHLRDVHARLKRHSCDICGRSFASKATKDDHHRTHTGERPYVCDTCGKSFKSKASLYTHCKIHTDEFPHPCLHCQKKFRRKQELLCHLSMHTGEKNFECVLCFRRFRLKTELRRHALVHSDDKPFVCNLCGFRCRQRRYLNNHVKYRHNFANGQEHQCP